MRLKKQSIAFGFYAVLLSLPLLLVAPNHANVAEQLHLFVRGVDNAPHQLFWDGSEWNGWTSHPGSTDETPAVASHDGQLHVFMRGLDHALYQMVWDGNEWSGWYRYDGYLASAPAVVSDNGELHVFMVGADNALYWMYWDGSDWNGWFYLARGLCHWRSHGGQS